MYFDGLLATQILISSTDRSSEEIVSKFVAPLLSVDAYSLPLKPVVELLRGVDWTLQCKEFSKQNLINMKSWEHIADPF